MRTAITFAVVPILTLIVAMPVSGQNIKGDWQLTECKIDGKDVPAEQLEHMKLSMTYTDFTATAGSRKSNGKLENQNRQRPPRLVFTIDGGEDSGRVLKAIYKRTGTNLQIAFSSGDEFPTGFESSADNQYALMTYSYIKRTRPTLSDDERRKQRAPSEIKGMRGG